MLNESQHSLDDTQYRLPPEFNPGMGSTWIKLGEFRDQRVVQLCATRLPQTIFDEVDFRLDVVGET